MGGGSDLHVQILLKVAKLKADGPRSTNNKLTTQKYDLRVWSVG